MTHQSTTWLAASYHFPSTYSIRVPMSSETHAHVLPTPGPATIRFALLRTSLEVFGWEKTQQILFPLLKSCHLAIRPPEKIAITQQQLRGYKRSPDKEHTGEIIQDSLLQREMVHAQGTMTIYVFIPTRACSWCTTLLRMIEYWGQSSSLTACLELQEMEPKREECMMPLAQLIAQHPQGMLNPWFCALIAEFHSEKITWKEVMFPNAQSRTPVLQLDVAVWPLKLIHQDVYGQYFHYQPFT